MRNNKKIQSNTASYNEWLEAKENLFNTYFDIILQGSLRASKVQEMHIAPKIFKTDFLEIGITDNEDKICIYIGNDKHENFSKGAICLYS